MLKDVFICRNIKIRICGMMFYAKHFAEFNSSKNKKAYMESS